MKILERIIWIGIWCISSSVLLTTCLSCDPLSYRIGVKVDCEHPVTKEPIQCKREKVPVGTVANYKCDSFYTNQDGDDFGGQIRCNDNGKWTPKNSLHGFSCQIDCGKPGKITKWPWHAAIFYRNSEHGSFKYSCGGTLINPFNRGFVVLTVSNCFPDGKRVDPANIRVALGLTSTEYIRNVESTYAQTYSVRVVTSNAQSGLTVIGLENDVQLVETVIPVCFTMNPALSEAQTLRNGDLVQFIGFGNDNTQPSLHGEDLIVKPCSRSTPKNAHSFCAGSNTNDTRICAKDFGSGMFSTKTTKDLKRHYLQGVLKDIEPQVVDDCSNSGVFTQVHNFTHWIKSTAEKFNDESQTETNKQQYIETTTVGLGLRESLSTVARPLSTTGRPPLKATTGRDELIPQRPYAYPRPFPTSRPAAVSTKSPFTTALINSQKTTEPPLVNPTDFQQSGLDWHNFYRRKHGVPEVSLSAKLNKESQYEAEQWIQNHSFRFQGVTNWFGSNGANLDSVAATRETVQDWYKTFGGYNWNQPTLLPFANVVWKATTHIGVGVARKGEKQVVVVKYMRPIYRYEEMEQAFKENILPAIS